MSATSAILALLVGAITVITAGGIPLTRWAYRTARRHEMRMGKLDQLEPNGGNSLRDKVDATADDVAEIKRGMFDQEKRQGRIEARQDHQGQVLDAILLELRRRP